jgi:hypothetical protein
MWFKPIGLIKGAGAQVAGNPFATLPNPGYAPYRKETMCPIR